MLHVLKYLEENSLISAIIYLKYVQNKMYPWIDRGIGVCVHAHAQWLSHVWLFATAWTVGPGSSVYGIFQARILEWVSISHSKGSSWPTDQIHISCVSCIGRQILYTEPPGKPQRNWYVCEKESQVKFNHKQIFTVKFF